MPDEYTGLPPDDETPQALLDDARSTMSELVPGWEPSDGAPDDAILAAGADEDATLYALLRESANDQFRGFGQTVYGIPPGDPTPAATTATWTSRTAAPVGGLELPGGTTIAVEAPQGLVGFEVVDDHVLAEGNTTLPAIAVQALEDGAAANGATGTVQMDSPLAWVLSVVLDDPASGGSDGQTEDQHLETIRRRIEGQSNAPIVPRDWELLAMETPSCERCLVLDLWDEETQLGDQERTVSLFPVDAAGEALTGPEQDAIRARGEERRELNWVVRVADPTYTEVDVEITVARTDGTVEPTALATAVQTAVASGPVSPGNFGLPLEGDRASWRPRTFLRRYEVAVAADNVRGCDYVVQVNLAAAGDTPLDADLALDGSAPLVRPGTVTVTVIDPV